MSSELLTSVGRVPYPCTKIQQNVVGLLRIALPSLVTVLHLALGLNHLIPHPCCFAVQPIGNPS